MAFFEASRSGSSVALPRAWRRAVRLARRLARHQRGAAAVEFALVVPVFLLIVFATIEVALFFFAQQVMEQATISASRQILTGQAQTAGLDQNAFRTLVCSNAKALFTCGNIVVDVRTYASFGSASTNRLVNGAGNIDSSGATYAAGTSGAIVVVRVAYEWPTFVRTLGFSLADLADGNRLIQSTIAMRVE